VFSEKELKLNFSLHREQIDNIWWSFW